MLGHLMQATCLASCNGAAVQLQRHAPDNQEQLRGDISAACAHPEHHVIVSYSRKGLLQTGERSGPMPCMLSTSRSFVSMRACKKPAQFLQGLHASPNLVLALVISVHKGVAKHCCWKLRASTRDSCLAPRMQQPPRR